MLLFTIFNVMQTDCKINSETWTTTRLYAFTQSQKCRPLCLHLLLSQFSYTNADATHQSVSIDKYMFKFLCKSSVTILAEKSRHCH